MQRVLAARGVGSRRKAEELIRAGRVTVDNQAVTELGAKVDPQAASIRVDGRLLRPQPLRYVLLHKPSGYITTTSDERGRRTVMDLVPASPRLYPVGRLDRDTDGLLLLTNDGDVANRVMHPRYGLAKEYHVLTLRRPSPATFQRLLAGIVLDGRRVIPDECRILREIREGIMLTVTVHEGINRVVRRLMEAVAIDVVRLRRVRLGPLTLSGLPVGAWRDLTPGERTTLFEALHLDRPPESLSQPRSPAQVQHPARRDGTKSAAPHRPAASRPAGERPSRPPATGRQAGSTQPRSPAAPAGWLANGRQPAPATPGTPGRRTTDSNMDRPPRRQQRSTQSRSTQMPGPERADRRTTERRPPDDQQPKRTPGAPPWSGGRSHHPAGDAEHSPPGRRGRRSRSRPPVGGGRPPDAARAAPPAKSRPPDRFRPEHVPELKDERVDDDPTTTRCRDRVRPKRRAKPSRRRH